MKNSFFISLGLVLALSLSLFCSCGDGKKNKDACSISLKSTASGDAAFVNSVEKTMNFLSGDTVTVVATPKKDCEFFGWYVGKEKTPLSKEANYTFVASQSVTLIAKFGKSPVVSLSSSDNGSASFSNSSENSMVVLFGKEVNVVATPNENCEFVGWFVDNSKVSTDVDYTFTVSKNVSVVAKFIKSPVVTLSSSENGNAAFENSTNKSRAVLSGKSVAVVATPDENCEFEGWYAGDTKVSADASYTFAVSKNIALIAKFYPSPVVVINSEKHGNVSFANSSDDAMIVLTGTDVTVTATPDKDYEFVGWFVNDAKVSPDASYTFAVSEDISLVAKFKPCPVVSISGSDNGSISFADSSDKSMIVLSGTDVTVTATPAKGYELYGWFVGDSETPVSKELVYNFAVNEDIKLFALFKQSLNGYEYVDLGLPSGLKWAKYNIGAETSEVSGGFYAWGETEEKENYDWSTYKYYDTTYSIVTKYCVRSRFGKVDGKKVLESEDDVAHVKWGNIWRMPTVEELDELCEVCTWEWTTMNDVAGYKVTGPNGNSIFLPAAGYKNGTAVLNQSVGGYYWSSSLISNGCGKAYYLLFDNTKYGKGEFSRRYSGRNVRPVFK